MFFLSALTFCITHRGLIKEGLRMDKLQRIGATPIFVVIGFVLVGISFFVGPQFRWSFHGKFTTIEKRTFRNEKVLLDSMSYRDCTFDGVTFIYNGTGPIQMEHNVFKGDYILGTYNPAVGTTVAALKGLGALTKDWPMYGPDWRQNNDVTPPMLRLPPTPEQQ
jgi:hypothetical protein